MCEEKTCTKWCGRTLPLSEFRTYSKGLAEDRKHYHFSYCKECQNYSSYLSKNRRGGKPIMLYAEFQAATRVERERREETKRLLAEGKRRCVTCDTIKEVTEFAKSPTKRGGITACCKTCFNKAQEETDCWKEPFFQTYSTFAHLINSAWKGVDYGNSRGCINERASRIQRWTKRPQRGRTVPA